MNRSATLRQMRTAGVNVAFSLANEQFALRRGIGYIISLKSGEPASRFRNVRLLARDGGRLCYVRGGEVFTLDPMLCQEAAAVLSGVGDKDAVFAHQRVLAVFRHGENKILLSSGQTDEFVQFGAKLLDFRADFAECAQVDNFVFSRRFLAWYDHDCGFFGVRGLQDAEKAAACRLLDGLQIDDEFYDASGALLTAEIRTLRDAIWPVQAQCAPRPNVESFVALSTGCADTSGTASCDSARAPEYVLYGACQRFANESNEVFARCLNGSVSTIREDSDGPGAARAREFRYLYYFSQERLAHHTALLQSPGESADQLFKRVTALLDGQ